MNEIPEDLFSHKWEQKRFFDSWKATPADVVALKYYTQGADWVCSKIAKTFRFSTKEEQHIYMVWHYAIIGAFERWTKAARVANSDAAKYRLKSKTHVYRGMSKICADFFRDMLQQPPQLHIGPLSTSASKQTFETFANKPVGGVGIEYEYIRDQARDEYEPLPVFYFSQYEDEMEYIMYQGTLNIDKIHFYPSKRKITAKEAAKCGPTDKKKPCDLRYGDPK